MRIPYSYLNEQFADLDPYMEEITALVRSGDFTLGYPVPEFERRFAELCGLPYAIGVSSGTDALLLSLKLLGIGHGDEVITAANTFIATVGAIAMAGATPVFVDNLEDYTIDPNLIEAAITPKTKAIMPVHLSGHPADMPAVMAIAEKHNLLVVEDAAQAIHAAIDGKHVGSWGETAGFSLHPLKNLNIWGDGGVIVTRSEEHYENLKLWRNHGLKTRDEVEFYAYNCRLDSLQAVVANRLIDQASFITDQRIVNANRFDAAFADLAEWIDIPTRKPNVKQVYHTYVIRVKKRDELLAYLLEKGVDAKVHYPIPMHLQKAAEHLGYKKGDFPVCEADCTTMLTLPVHQHLADEDMQYMIDTVHEFYQQ
jgi:dTDP-3-amino-2,3,6-trideoxy-4-keto-D-glucose/dTDP-3-amino-3,4,6-trideoxy-alpha-D-glucose/dTDP-2,6-dideoxy-D-kanosamine transaminase